MKKLVALCIAGLAASNAQAGGLWLNHWGDISAGRASAGAAAGGDEAATIIHNPATATQLEGKQLFLSGGLIVPDIQFDISDSNPVSGFDDGGDAGLAAPVATFAYVHDSGSERWRFGVYTAGLSGAGLDYNNDWVGRFQTTDVELLVLAIAPTIAYRLTDTLSIGFAPQAYYATLDLTLRIPTLQVGAEKRSATLDGDDTGFAFNAGLAWELSDQTRLGIDYQSEIDTDFDGKLRGNLGGVEVQSNTNMPLAQKVRVGLNHQLDDQFGFWFTLGWDDWSTLDEVFVALPEQGAGLQKAWEDTYHYATGFQYQMSRDWEITSGIAYDTNPVSAADRTADLPVDRQVRYNIGARYRMRDGLTLGGYLNYTDLGSAKISGDLWSGDYSSNSMIEFAISANWTF